jgi:LysR family hydrogen peroxide-inducible transcriptional activator
VGCFGVSKVADVSFINQTDTFYDKIDIIYICLERLYIIMTLQQLEYIVSVDTHRHFSKAAEACFVTQATLSMMIKKLEEELGVTVFDRSKQPVIPTETGKALIQQARMVLRESGLIKQLATEAKEEVRGELRMGIIPTLAPYLLPLFLQQFLAKYPAVHINITELTTDEMIQQLETDRLDVGILATPLNLEGIKEEVLFYEALKVFVSGTETALNKKYVLPEQLDVKRLWLLEEGHCLRSQMLNLCELKKDESYNVQLKYEAGSIESLIRIVEMNNGITIVPELATFDFSESRKQQLRSFKKPVPVREVSLVTYRHFAKKRLLEALKSEIVAAVRPLLHQQVKDQDVIPI